ncbi:MAG TPA: hypothetical protein VEU47_13440 [Candidatus Cybelea sp.]|nr:hypothetical protein [Candidatus Cybelea sp.]
MNDVDDRRIALERADAAREVLRDLLAEIDQMSARTNEAYRKGFKQIAIRINDRLKAPLTSGKPLERDSAS